VWQMSDPVSELSDGEIHLWFASPGECNDPSLADAARRILAAGEIVRMDRLSSAENRRLFTVSHLLIRTALSYYEGRPPEEWRFISNDHGKPLIDPGMNPSRLKFSLAHTAELAVVGVTKEDDIGVDLERKDRRVNAEGLSRRYFSPEESRALGGLTAVRLRSHFFLYWTLKEAAIKALGRGLSLPLRKVGFRLSGRRPHRIGFSGADLPGAANMRFALIEPLPPYIAAVCVICDPAKAVTVKCYRVVPLRSVEPLRFLTVGFSDDRLSAAAQ
jgi:4'-phosphopantetheinyl transferase